MPVRSLVDYVERSAQRHPDRVAIVDPQGWSLTYRELNEMSARVAGFLVSVGVMPGDRVGVILPKGAAGVVAFVGVMKARAAYVPADYTAPAARNRSILQDCQVKVAFLAGSGAAILESWNGTPRPLVVFVGAGPAEHGGGWTWDKVTSHAAAVVDGRTRSDLAYILYTSGSTGVPKGVMLTHENALSFVDWCSSVFHPVETDRFSSHAPFHFDLSILDLYVPLKHGASVHIVSEDLGKSPKELARFIAASALTVWYSTPSILSLLAQFGDLPSLDFPALRLVLFAGEVFPVKHLRDLVGLWPAPDYYNLYGPTETNVCTFAKIPTPIDGGRTEPFPIGFACSHCRGLVLRDDGSEAAGGEEGLLYIAGPSVFPGYWNRPEMNAAVFDDRAAGPWYNTGDVVRFDPHDGYVYVGRRDRMVKRRGYRIELGEIERGLYLHPAVAEAAVVSVPEADAGVRIVAFLAAQTPKPSIIEMKMFCGRNLPAYMSPDAFVVGGPLPRTSTDKVDYQALKRMAENPKSAS
jgi:amino acid adenylation domain-containing protein